MYIPPEGLEIVEWCQLCNSARADGDLEIRRDGAELHETEWIKACTPCVEKLGISMQLQLDI